MGRLSLHTLDMIIHNGDDASERYYKDLLNDQLDWCNANREIIERKANNLYMYIRSMSFINPPI